MLFLFSRILVGGSAQGLGWTSAQANVEIDVFFSHNPAKMKVRCENGSILGVCSKKH